LAVDSFRETFVCDPHREIGELLERAIPVTHITVAATVIALLPLAAHGGPQRKARVTGRSAG